MKDFNFKLALEEHPFRGGNYYYWQDHQPSDFMVYNTKMYPLIMYGIVSGDRTDAVPWSLSQQFRSRVVTRDKLIEIVETSPVLLKILVGDQCYFVGKGFIGFKPAVGNMMPLFVCTVPGETYTANVLEDITALVLNTFDTYHTTIKSVIQHFMKVHPGDIFITKNIQKYITGKITLPRLPSIEAKRAFTLDFIEKCYGSL